MIAAVCAALLVQGAMGRALAWADHGCELLDRPMSILPLDAAEVRQRYENVVRLFGPSWRVSRGIARCWVKEGRYRLAAGFYRSQEARHVPAAEARRALRMASIVDQLEKSPPARSSVRQIAEVAGSGGAWWAVAWTHRSAAPGQEEVIEYFDRTSIQLVRVDPATGRVIERGRETVPSDDDSEMAREVQIASAMLDGRSQPGVLLYIGRWGGDSWPEVVLVYRTDHGKLSKVQAFRGKGGIEVFRRSPTRPVVVDCTPTWKVWWNDCYEYTRRGFVFANPRYPERYRERIRTAKAPGPGPSEFEFALDAAASLMIARDYRAAYAALRRAERLCRPYAGGTQVYFGFWRDPAGILREIRQRMAWIRRRDFNHILLYRPYDWDLQVPPYRVGKVGS